MLAFILMFMLTDIVLVSLPGDEHLVTIPRGMSEAEPQGDVKIDQTAEDGQVDHSRAPVTATTLSGIDGGFVENLGQLEDGTILYYALGKPLSVYFGKDQVTFKLMSTDGQHSTWYKVGFEGSNPKSPEGLVPLRQRMTYLIGDSRGDWVPGARCFGEIRYTDLWDNIDLHYLVERGTLKYEFTVHPGGDVDDIQMAYGGVGSLGIQDRTGTAIIGTALGDIIDSPPLSYQLSDRGETPVVTSFFKVDQSTLGFRAAEYDRRTDLVIDPGLEFSTYFGGSGKDWCYGTRLMCVTADGNIYITGRSDSLDLPTTDGAYSETKSPGDNDDIFVAKLDADASSLLFCTYIGGNGEDYPNAMDVDENGRVVLVGGTNSTDFPTTSDAISTDGSTLYDAYVICLDDDCTNLTYSTYVGGSSNTDLLDGIARDGTNDYYISGYTNSTDFPATTGSFCTTVRDYDTVIMKFSSTDWQLLFSTFIGGSGPDYPVFDGKADICVDDKGNILFITQANSDDFPMAGSPYDPNSNGDRDVAICRLSSDGSALIQSTYLGGTGLDAGDAISIDGKGNIWVGGTTASTDFPITQDALQKVYGGASFGQRVGDAYLAKLDSNLSHLFYCTYFSGLESDWLTDIAIDAEDNPIVLMYQWSDTLVTPRNAIDTVASSSGTADCYVLWLASNGTQILNATYFGGSGYESPMSLCLKSDGVMLFYGQTHSSDYPTTSGCYQSTSAPDDMFITAISMTKSLWAPPGPPVKLTASPQDSTIELSWGQPAGPLDFRATDYLVYRGTSPSTLEYYDTTPSAHLTVSGLVNGRTYFFGIIAKNIIGEGPMSTIIGIAPYAAPSAPNTFSVYPGFQNITLMWKEPSAAGGFPILGYRIFRGDSEEGMSYITSISNSTNYIDMGAVIGHRYYYKMQAFHQFANGSFTEIRSAVAFGLPDPPRELRAVAGDKKVQLSWLSPLSDGGIPIKGYRLYRGPDADSLLPIKILPVMNDYLDSDLVNGFKYYYSISAFTDAGDSPTTSIVPATPVGPPGPPWNLEAVVGDGWVLLHWRPALDSGGSPITGYRVLRGTSPDSFREVQRLGNVTEFNDTGLTNGMTYFYTVITRTAAGESLPEPPINAKPVGPPTATVGLRIEAEIGKVAFTWLAPESDGGSPIVRYEVLRGPTEAALEHLTDLGPTSTTYIDTNVEIGRTYYYIVIAFNRMFSGPQGDIVEAIPYGEPAAPVGLTGIVRNGTIQLEWSPPISDGGRTIEEYVVYRGTSLISMERHASVGPSLRYTDRNFEYGQTYHYYITAINLAGEGDTSDAIEIAPALPTFPPGVPLGLVGRVDGGRVRLTWEPPSTDGGSPIVGYIILKGSNPNDLETITEIGPELAYTDEAVEAGITYHYAIAAKNSVGTGNSTVPIPVKILDGQVTMAGNWTFVLLGAILAITFGSVIVIAYNEPWRYAFVVLLLPLLSRLASEDVLEHKVRYAIQGIIIEKPGIHYSAIIKELGLANGVAAYHLEVLEREHFIRSVNDGRYKRFLSVDTKVPPDFRISPDEVKQRLLELIRRIPGIAQKEIIEELGIERDTVGYHLREMVKSEQLIASKDGKFTTYHVHGIGAPNMATDGAKAP